MISCRINKDDWQNELAYGTRAGVIRKGEIAELIWKKNQRR